MATIENLLSEAQFNQGWRAIPDDEYRLFESLIFSTASLPRSVIIDTQMLLIEPGLEVEVSSFNTWIKKDSPDELANGIYIFTSILGNGDFILFLGRDVLVVDNKEYYDGKIRIEEKVEEIFGIVK